MVVIGYDYITKLKSVEILKANNCTIQLGYSGKCSYIITYKNTFTRSGQVFSKRLKIEKEKQTVK